jgi:hypothetical protein
MLSNVTGWIKKLTEAGVGLVGLAIVAQVIFGSSVAFLPGGVFDQCWIRRHRDCGNTG